MKRCGRILDQQEFVRTHKDRYWEWHTNNREGLVSRGQLIDLMSSVGLPIRKYLHTNSVDDLHQYLSKHYSNGYFGGYILTRKPTNHCLSLVKWDGDSVQTMDPSPGGGFATHPWSYWQNDRDSDFLVFLA